MLLWFYGENQKVESINLLKDQLEQLRYPNSNSPPINEKDNDRATITNANFNKHEKFLCICSSDFHNILSKKVHFIKSGG